MVSLKNKSRSASATSDEELRALLQAGKLKVTKSRLAILRALASEKKPQTPAEIFDHVCAQAGNIKCDLVTIYRCLAKFENMEIIERCNYGGMSGCYQLAVQHRHRHYIHAVNAKPTTPCQDVLSSTK